MLLGNQRAVEPLQRTIYSHNLSFLLSPPHIWRTSCSNGGCLLRWLALPCSLPRSRLPKRLLSREAGSGTPRGSDDINAKINEATARMNIAMRGIGRSRLRKTNAPYQRITIAYNPQQVTITTDSRAAIQTPGNGTPVRWKREDGEMLTVSTGWKNTVLEQTFAAEDGKRVNRYTLSSDGRMMTLEVTITSPRLPQPLVYRQMYHRA